MTNQTQHAEAVLRAFISHGSEDKDRFVLPFATRLRELGVDAWVDRWEMGPGDSLVERIFEEGIGEAGAFVVVLSHTSVVKPWVKEELGAAVVRRINSGGSKRLIPVVLDSGVAVPHSLQHLLWESVPEHGLEGVAQNIADALQGVTAKPKLGGRPTYTQTPVHWTTEPADETVFQLIAAEIRSHGPGWILFSDDVQQQAKERGIPDERFAEAMAVLQRDGLVAAKRILGGYRWMLEPFSDRTWLALEQDQGVDLHVARKELLAAIVNGQTTSLDLTTGAVNGFTMLALLREFHQRGLMSVTQMANKQVHISQVSPLARRALRDMDGT